MWNKTQAQILVSVSEGVVLKMMTDIPGYGIAAQREKKVYSQLMFPCNIPNKKARQKRDDFYFPWNR